MHLFFLKSIVRQRSAKVKEHTLVGSRSLHHSTARNFLFLYLFTHKSFCCRHHGHIWKPVSFASWSLFLWILRVVTVCAK